MATYIENPEKYKVGPLPHVYSTEEILRDAQTTLVRFLKGDELVKDQVLVICYDVFMIRSAAWTSYQEPLWEVYFYQEGPQVRVNNSKAFRGFVEGYLAAQRAFEGAPK